MVKWFQESLQISYGEAWARVISIALIGGGIVAGLILMPIMYGIEGFVGIAIATYFSAYLIVLLQAKNGKFVWKKPIRFPPYD